MNPLTLEVLLAVVAVVTFVGVGAVRASLERDGKTEGVARIGRALNLGAPLVIAVGIVAYLLVALYR